MSWSCEIHEKEKTNSLSASLGCTEMGLSEVIKGTDNVV